MDGMTGLVERAKRVRDTEGIVSLLRRSFAFVFGSVVFYRTYDLYESSAQDMDGYREADFLPNIQQFTYAVVASLQDAEELKANGLDLYAQMS